MLMQHIKNEEYNVNTYIHYRYLPKGAFQEQWLYYIIYNN